MQQGKAGTIRTERVRAAAGGSAWRGARGFLRAILCSSLVWTCACGDHPEAAILPGADAGADAIADTGADAGGVADAEVGTGPATDSGSQVLLAAVPSEDTIFGWIEDIAGLGVRLPDTQASIRAAEYVRDEFAALGLTDVAIEETESVVWSAQRAGLSVAGEELPCGAMQHTFHHGSPVSFSTGSEGFSGELVYVGDGSPNDLVGLDLTGKVVVADVRFHRLPLSLVPLLSGELYDPQQTVPADYELVDPYYRKTFPDNYYKAQKAGAKAFIGVLVDYIDSHAYHNEAYSSYLPGEAMEVPGLWLSRREGQALVARIQGSATPLLATVRLEGELAKATGRNTIGYLRGQSAETLLVESHHDSATTGAVDDASGTAEVLAIAHYFAQLPLSQRPRTLLFATMDTHFTDYASHRAFLARHIVPEPILTSLTVEHVARDWVEDESGGHLTGLVAPRILFVSDKVTGLLSLSERAVEQHGLVRTAVVPTTFFAGLGLPADSSTFFNAGLPVIALVGAPIYHYDDLDTLDKVAKESLVPVAETLVDIASQWLSLPSKRFQPRQLAE